MAKEIVRLRARVRAAEETNAMLEVALHESEATSADLRAQLHEVGETTAAQTRVLARRQTAMARREKAVEETARRLETQNEEVLRAARKAARAAEARVAAAEAHEYGVRRTLEACALVGDRAWETWLKAGYLAHYWCAARDLGVHREVAHREAALWANRAPPGGDEALTRVVERAAWSVTDQSRAGEDERLRGRSLGAVPSEWLAGDDEETGAARWRPTTAADAMEVEVSLRTMTATRVEESVLVALADRRRALEARTISHKTPAAAEEWLRLSPAETREVVYRRAWLCFVWLRARGAGVEPGLAELRCEAWLARAAAAPRGSDAGREALEVEEGLREVRDLGVEWQLWRRREEQADDLRSTSRSQLEALAGADDV